MDLAGDLATIMAPAGAPLPARPESRPDASRIEPGDPADLVAIPGMMTKVPFRLYLGRDTDFDVRADRDAIVDTAADLAVQAPAAFGIRAGAVARDVMKLWVYFPDLERRSVLDTGGRLAICDGFLMVPDGWHERE